MNHRRQALVALALAVVAVAAAVVSIHAFRHDRPPAPAIEGLPSTPPLGWNSWNAFGCNVNEKRIESQADAMVASGMRQAGYRYIVIDDCWFDPDRDDSGHIRANPSLFPSGMKAVGDYIHSRGLKFGLYASAGDATCAQLGGSYPGRTGSRGHERADAQTFAEWGVDYLKYDWCGTGASMDTLVGAFTVMRDALRATGRPIFYSINPNSGASVTPAQFDRFDGVATMTRVSHDVIPVWDTVDTNATSQGIVDALDNASRPDLACTPNAAFFCDYDMLTVGSPQVAGIYTPPLNEAECRTQLALWAVWGAPLLAGNDLSRMAPQIAALLTNSDVLAIDQDSATRRATNQAGRDGDIWTRRLSDASTAIAIVNRDDVALPFAASLSALGLPLTAKYDVLEVFSGKRTVQPRRYATTIGPHDTVLLRAKPL